MNERLDPMKTICVQNDQKHLEFRSTAVSLEHLRLHEVGSTLSFRSKAWRFFSLADLPMNSKSLHHTFNEYPQRFARVRCSSHLDISLALKS